MGLFELMGENVKKSTESMLVKLGFFNKSYEPEPDEQKSAENTTSDKEHAESLTRKTKFQDSTTPIPTPTPTSYKSSVSYKTLDDKLLPSKICPVNDVTVTLPSKQSDADTLKILTGQLNYQEDKLNLKTNNEIYFAIPKTDDKKPVFIKKVHRPHYYVAELSMANYLKNCGWDILPVLGVQFIKPNNETEQFLITPRCSYDFETYLRNKNKTVKNAFQIISFVAKQISALHNNGLVHRDLKPRNIFLNLDEEGNHIYITDWETIVKDRTDTKNVVGSIPYVAPEGFYAHTITTKEDVFALGLMLYKTILPSFPTVKTLTNQPKKCQVLNKDENGNETYSEVFNTEYYRETNSDPELYLTHPQFTQAVTQQLGELSNEYISLVKDALKTNPDERITAKELYKRLNTLTKHYKKPQQQIPQEVYRDVLELR